MPGSTKATYDVREIGPRGTGARMGPLQANHPIVTRKEICVACANPLKAGQYVTLISFGPGDDKEQQQLARDHKPYRAVAVPVHWACATGGSNE